MKTTKANETVLDGVDEGRRDFVKKLVAGTAFATPLLASFSMDGALIGEAEAAGATYYAPYCGDNDVFYSYTARFQTEDKSVRFNATLIADVLDGTTFSVVLNFSPRNNFKSGQILVGGTWIANLQLGPNVIPMDNYYVQFPTNNPCQFLEQLTSGGGIIGVKDYDDVDYYKDLVGHG